MNTLEHTVVRILEPTKQVVTDELCCWQVKALVNCYGFESEHTFNFTSRASADMIKAGYSYLA